MKNILILCISLLFNLMLNGQELSAETLKTHLTGYWQGNQFTNPQEVLVINSDQTYQYYKNKVRVDYGRLEIEYKVMFRLKFNSHFGYPAEAGTYNNYIWILPDETLQFGDSPVDGGDVYFQKMDARDIDHFWGKQLLSKAFKKKSADLILQYFAEWQSMESGTNSWIAAPPAALTAYQQEAYTFFGDFYRERLEPVETPKYSLVELSLRQIGYADFSLPNTSEMDSFVNKFTGKTDYRAAINNDKAYNKIVIEDFWGRYFQHQLTTQKIMYDQLYNFAPALPGNKNITYLPLHSGRAKVIKDCMLDKDKNYANWYFMKNYICPDGGIQYDITATTMIQKLTFNTQLNLAIVEFVYPYSWVTHLYEKKDGKWQFHSAIQHQTQ